MLRRLLSSQSPYKKRARLFAILWTLLIFIACFIPGNELPNVHIPMADKWVHFVLFGVFAFAWLCTDPKKTFSFLLLIFAASVALGWLVEFLQGQLKFLGRSQDNMDALADSIGGLIGIVFFYLLFTYMERNKKAA